MAQDQSIMEYLLENITSEHQFEVVRNQPRFYIDVGELRPFRVSEGNWCLVPLHVSSTQPLQFASDAEFKQGFQLVSYQCLSGRDKPLSVAHFSAKAYQEAGNSVVFDKPFQRPYPITHKSSLLYLELRALDGTALALPAGGQILLGLALLQYAS